MKVIIHDVDDDSYPDVDEKRLGISGWFKLELWHFYHAGIEFILSIETGIKDALGRWKPIRYGQAFDKRRFNEIQMWKIARIPYRNIVDYDLDGDEYYPHPHLYCRFADGGSPYDGIRYAMNRKGEYAWPMDPQLQLKTQSERRPRGRGRKRR